MPTPRSTRPDLSTDRQVAWGLRLACCMCVADERRSWRAARVLL